METLAQLERMEKVRRPLRRGYTVNRKTKMAKKRKLNEFGEERTENASEKKIAKKVKCDRSQSFVSILTF